MTRPEADGGRTWPVVAAVLLVFLGVAAPLPVLPKGVHALGASSAALGVVLGVFPFAAVGGRLLAGRWCDGRGRIATLRLGTACGIGAGLLMALPTSLPVLVASRLVQGLGDALVYTAAATYVIDRTPAHRRAQALSLLGSGVWGGYALGPLVGGLAGGVRTAGLVVAGTGVLAALALAGQPETEHRGRREPGLRGLLPRGVAKPGIALGLGNLGYAAVIGYLVLAVDSRGGHGAVALAAFSVSVLAGRLVVVPLASRFGLLRMLPAGLCAMAAGLLSLTQVTSTLAASAAAVVIGVGYCLPFPALASLVAGRVPEHQRGSAIGALTAFYDVFVGVGSLVFGLVADRWGVSAVFLLAAAGVLASAGLDLVLARREGASVPALADTAPDV